MTSSTTAERWRDWLTWLLVGALLYGVLCLLTLASDVGRPFPGFFTYHNLMTGQIEMVRNAPSWWWGVTAERPTITDRLIQVEGVPFSDLHIPVNERLIYENAWRAGQKTVSIAVERDGALLTLDVPLIEFSWRHYLDYLFAPVVISATLWLLAWLLYRAAPANPTQRLAAALHILMGFLPIGVQPSLFFYDQLYEEFINLGTGTTLAGLLMSVLFFQLAIRFPYPLVADGFRVGVWVMAAVATVVATGSVLLYGVTRVLLYFQGIIETVKFLEGLYFRSFISIMLLGILAVTLRVVADSFFLANSRRHKQEARILLLAMLVSFPAIWLIGHYLQDDSAVLEPLQFLADSRFFPLALPLAFAAISLRYNTFSGAENWFFLALLLAGAGLLANVGTALLFWGRLPLIWETAVPPTLILFFLFVLVGVLAGWLTSWRGWLGRVFAWERVSYQAVQQMGQQLLAAPRGETATVAQTLAETLQKTLEVERTAVWVIEREALTQFAQAGDWPAPPPTRLQWPANYSYYPARASELTTLTENQALHQITAFIPMTLTDALIGVIAIGPRWDTAVFDDRDLEILSLIGQQAALFLQNSRQTARLRAADQQMLAALTQARQKTAQELHDHLLPTLARLQISLLAASAILKTEPEQASKTLGASQQDLATSTNLVRRIQQNMVTRPLEYGLFAYLLEMLERFHHDTGVMVEHTLPADLDERLQDVNLREILYTVWLQGLDNVRRHAQATRVNLTLNIQDGQITFAIVDNGRGSSLEEREKAMRAGHFGLRSLQIRLEAVGGSFHFWSQPGKGSRLTGHLSLYSKP